MKQEAYILLWLLGLAGLGVLLHQLGEPEVWQHVVMMGWGYVPIIGITLAAYMNNVCAWRESFDGGTERPRMRPLLWVKLVGEALGNVMPASQIGKEVAKVMMLRERMGVTAGVSSLVLTKTGEMVSGVLFVVGGVLAGLHRYVFPEEIQWALFATLTIAVFGAAFTVVRQRRDPFTGLVNLLARMRISFVARFRNRAAEIDRNLAGFYRLKGWRLAGLLGIHLVTWGLGTLEIYVILRVLGEPMPFVSVYLFHSLMMVINLIFGFVPVRHGGLRRWARVSLPSDGTGAGYRIGRGHRPADPEDLLDAARPAPAASGVPHHPVQDAEGEGRSRTSGDESVIAPRVNIVRNH